MKIHSPNGGSQSHLTTAITRGNFKNADARFPPGENLISFARGVAWADAVSGAPQQVHSTEVRITALAVDANGLD